MLVDADTLRRAGCGPLALAVATRRHAGHSWRAITIELGCGRASARAAYAEAQRRAYQHEHQRPYRDRDAVVPLGEQVRGWPAVGYGIRGAISGSIPGADLAHPPHDALSSASIGA